MVFLTKFKIDIKQQYQLRACLVFICHLTIDKASASWHTLFINLGGGQYVLLLMQHDKVIIIMGYVI